VMPVAYFKPYFSLFSPVLLQRTKYMIVPRARKMREIVIIVSLGLIFGILRYFVVRMAILPPTR